MNYVDKRKALLDWLRKQLIGPASKQEELLGISPLRRVLGDQIDELIEQGGLSPGDVTILSPLGFEDSSLIELPARIAKAIMVMDEYSVRFFPGKQISFARIADFKGLENNAVIVVDLPPPSSEAGDIAAHYVAMSRARSVLSLVYRCVR